MKELMASFVQHIPIEGYQLKRLQRVNFGNGVRSQEEAKALCWPEDSSYSRSYEPLKDEEALYCKFFDLTIDPGADRILEFANNYGWIGLGDTAMETESSLLERGVTNTEVINAEFIEHWYQQLRLFVPFVELWNALSTNDSHYLESVIQWTPEHSSVSYGFQQSSSMLIASTTTNSELLTTLIPGDVVVPAKIVLTRIINQRLEEHCSPALLFQSAAYHNSELYFRCSNLLGVIWLQFARAVASKTVSRRCVECGVPFLPHRGERGKRKRFCTDACKSKNYRQRIQTQATAMN